MIPTPKPSKSLPMYRKEVSYTTKDEVMPIIPFSDQINKLKNNKRLTLANDMQSQPMILGIAAIIRDCPRQHKQ